MTKAELMCYVGKKVHIYFKDGYLKDGYFEDGEKGIYGTLGYVNEFSAKYGYRKPNDFYIDNISFKASLVRKLAESEDEKNMPLITNFSADNM